MADQPTFTEAETGLSPESVLDGKLQALWGLGRNIILACTPGPNCLEVLVVPHYAIADFAHEHPPSNTNDIDPIIDIITGAKIMSAERMVGICQLLSQTPDLLKLPFDPENDIGTDKLGSVDN